MTRKTISTAQASVLCEVCGRTLLRGEHAEVFIHAGGRRTVCELCSARAAHEGWIREGLDDAAGVRRSGPDRRSLLGRLRQRRDAAGRDGDVEDGLGDHEVPEPPVAPAPRSVRAVPTNADMKMARALDLFNASEHPRTIAGVARSLGIPYVTVRPSQTEGSVVTAVVAWELCWYRYEIDLADEAAGVRVTGQGYELSELEPADQAPNAAAAEHGQLELVG